MTTRVRRNAADELADYVRRATQGLAPTADQYATITMALERARSIAVQVGSEYSRALVGGQLWAKGDDPEYLKQAVAQNLVPVIVPYIPTGNDLVEKLPGFWMFDMEDLAERIHDLLAAEPGREEQQ